MEQKPLSELPDEAKLLLKQTLDRREKPNWQTLIKVLPGIAYSKYQIEKFHLAILKPDKSPTTELLNDLSKKGKTIGELIQSINALGHQFQELQPLVYELHRNIGGNDKMCKNIY